MSIHIHPHVNMPLHMHVHAKKWLRCTAEMQCLYNIDEGLSLTHNISQKKMDKCLRRRNGKGEHCNSCWGHQKMVDSLRAVGRSNHGVLKLGINSHSYIY